MTAATSRPTDPAGEPTPRRTSIGLFGGTFDPPHLGHLAAAHQALVQLELDEVWLVVAHRPWQKEGERRITAAATRLEWVASAVADEPGLVASDLEIRRGGASYTIDTVTDLVADRPEVDPVVIIGRDAAEGLDTWHRADELRAMVAAGAVGIGVVDRPGSDGPLPPAWSLQRIEMPGLDLSSTAIRRFLARGRSVRFLVPSRIEGALADAFADPDGSSGDVEA